MAKPLSPKAQQAAALEAQGFGVQEVADEVGLSRGQLSVYRNHDERYKELVLRYTAEALEEIQLDLVEVRRKSLSAVLRAIDTLERQLDSTDRDGNPREDVRKDAANILFNSPVIRALFKDLGEMEGRRDQGPPQAAVTIIFKEGNEYDVEEGEFTEDG